MQSEPGPERNRDEADDGGPQHDLKRGRHISMMHLRDNDREYRGRHRGLNHQHGFEGKVQRRNFRQQQDESGRAPMRTAMDAKIVRLPCLSDSLLMWSAISAPPSSNASGIAQTASRWSTVSIGATI
jgi:hypothetical protein